MSQPESAHGPALPRSIELRQTLAGHLLRLHVGGETAVRIIPSERYAFLLVRELCRPEWARPHFNC